MQHIQNRPTIVAIATPLGRAGIGVVRISGEHAFSIASVITGINSDPGHMRYVSFYARDKTCIDRGMLLKFKSPHSYTGEDVVELQAHGNPIVLQLLVARCIELGAMQARPGEFTERAFLNERLDLVKAEAVADLISASSIAQVKAAQRSLQGEFSQHIENILKDLIAIRMYVEAAIDFPEEEIDFLQQNQIVAQLTAAQGQIEQLLQSARWGQRLRDGLHVVLAGPPNAGKSSLLNALAGEERAIVTPIAGTTRDVLRETILLDGLEISLADTAGLRESSDAIETEGIRRAEVELAQADIILFVLDATEEVDYEQYIKRNAQDAVVIIIHNKIDCLIPARKAYAEQRNSKTHLWLSAHTKDGLVMLRDALMTQAGQEFNQQGTFSARARHVSALVRVQQHLMEGMQHLQSRAGELLAEELRCAQQDLSEITGQFTADDLLGNIFSSFCIGK